MLAVCAFIVSANMESADYSVVLPPIPTKGLTTADVDALVTRTRDAMMNELIRLSHVSGAGNSDPLPRTTRGGSGKEGLSKRM